MKIKNNYHGKPSLGEIPSDKPSATIPGQAMSVSEVIARHDLGAKILEDGRLVYPDEEFEEVIFPMNVDLTDIDDIRENVKFLQSKLREAKIKEVDKAKAKEVADAEKADADRKKNELQSNA